jgi:hypothetical protein
MSRLLPVLLLALAAGRAAAADVIVRLGGVRLEGGAEIAAYDADSRRLFVVAGRPSLSVLDLTEPTAPKLVKTIDLSGFGVAATSVSARAGRLVVCVQGPPGARGRLVVIQPGSLEVRGSVATGFGPDMVTLTYDGDRAVVCDEGKPTPDYTVDPPGSVTVVDIDALTIRSTTIGFEGVAVPDGVRIYGPRATAAQDLEPEYVAVEQSGRRAYVVLQENDAVAVIDLRARRVERLFPLGWKDHRAPGAGLDPSDRDGGAKIGNWPVRGLYQPDSAAWFTAGGQTLLFMANEGDLRDLEGFRETARVSDLKLDAEAFPDAEALQRPEALGRLRVSTVHADPDGDGDVDALYGVGARSVSLWSVDGLRLWDSGEDLERAVLETTPRWFNAGDGVDAAADERSDRSGPEPEGCTVGLYNGRVYGFVGLERPGGVVVYDLTDPRAPRRLAYVNPRESDGDRSPEGLLFVPGEDAPQSRPLLVVCNEGSGTVAVYEVKPMDVPPPAAEGPR